DVGEAVGDGLFLGLLKGEGVVEGARDQVRKGVEQKRFLVGDFHEFDGFDVKNAVQMVGIEDGQSHGGEGIGKHGLGSRLIVGGGAEGNGLAGASDLTNEAGVKRKPAAESATASAAFGLNDKFARGVIHQGDANMVVSETVFQLLGHFCEDFIGVQ